MTTSDNGPLDLLGGMTRSGMSFEQLWLRQVGLGGNAAMIEVEAYVLGLLHADAYQHDLIAQALNEYFIERGEAHPVGYADARADTDAAYGADDDADNPGATGR